MVKIAYLAISVSLLLASCAQQEHANFRQSTNQLLQETQAIQVKQENAKSILNEFLLPDVKKPYQSLFHKERNKHGITLVIDGTELNTNPSLFFRKDELYIPLSYVSKHLETGVIYNIDSKTIGIHKGKVDIDMAIGSEVAKINNYQIESPPVIEEKGDIFLPIGFIAEILGYSVNKNLKAKMVRIEAYQTNRDTGSLNNESIPVQGSVQRTYRVRAGDNLTSIARRFKTTAPELRRLNNLKNNTIKVGQILTIPGEKLVQKAPQKLPVSSMETIYTVRSGDNLTSIAKRFKTTIDELKKLNHLKSNAIRVGQTLRIPAQRRIDPQVPKVDPESRPPIPQAPKTEIIPAPTPQDVTVSYLTHMIQPGETLWNLSIRYGIPMLQLARENNLSVDASLSIGQVLKIPVYNVPARPVVSSRHGELLGWWTEGRYVFPTGTEATVTDFQTGRTFNVKHTMGGNHADSEPLTSHDAQIMKEIWGGNYSWTPRAIIISVKDRRLAAAMHSFPHSIQSIRDNNYEGHFCIHFLNSTRHVDGLVQESMQRQIKIAAGVN